MGSVWVQWSGGLIARSSEESESIVLEIENIESARRVGSQQRNCYLSAHASLVGRVLTRYAWLG